MRQLGGRGYPTPGVYRELWSKQLRGLGLREFLCGHRAPSGMQTKELQEGVFAG